ncbi:MAG: InlB B-repeat-containing protein, partial [Oscillospiraceae bacterium]|nr:InlB B-repeat-containing protein [Oscillospiraceae bacterium]
MKIRKKWLSILLVLVLCIGMLSGAALAEEPETPAAENPVEEAAEDSTEEPVEEPVEEPTEEPIEESAQVESVEMLMLGTAPTELGGTLESGTYTLTADVALAENITIPSGADVTIDLAGYTLTGAGGDSVITVDGGTLTIQDSDGAGTITGGTGHTSGAYNYGGGIYVINGGSLTLESGTISGNTAKTGGGIFVGAGSAFTMNGGAITNNNGTVCCGGVNVEGTFTMNGGTISGNTAKATGGGVRADNGGVFTMTGGSITGNTVTLSSTYGGGAGVYLTNATMNMTGGSITSNTVTATSTSGKAASGGGGVYLYSGSVLNMSGGSITGNSSCMGGGGVQVQYNGTTISQMNVSGSAVISGNTTSGATNNVYLTSNTTSKVTEYITLTGALTQDASIGVTTAATVSNGTDVVFIQYGQYTSSLARFNSDADYYVAVNANGAFVLTLNEPTYYTVTFDSNGGSEVTSQSVIEYGTATAEEPTLKDYTFEGWYTAAGDAYDFATRITANITLYARWKAVAAITMAEVYQSYTGQAITASGAVLTLPQGETYDGEIVYTYYADEACTQALDGAPVNAGTYYVVASIAETDTVNAAASDPVKLTILEGEFAVTAVGYTGVYDGAGHSITVTAEGAEITYSTDGETYSAENLVFTNAGEYTVYYTAHKDNYTDVTGSVTVVISRAAQAVSFAESQVSKTEGDDPFTNALTGAAGAVAYESSNTAVATVDDKGEVTIVGAGTAEITATVGETDNYEGTALSYTVTVTAASVPGEIVAPASPSPEPTTQPTETPDPTTQPVETPETTTEPTETPESTAEPTETPESTAEPSPV